MYTYSSPDNLVALIENSVKKHAQNPLFGTPDSQGQYSWITYEKVGARIDNLRAGLAAIGIKANDTLGVISRNRVEWAVAAFAAFGLGARFIPMYEKELPKIWRHIIHDGEIKALFVPDEGIKKQIEALRPDLPELKTVICIDGEGDETMHALERSGRQNPVAAIHPQPDDIAVLIYTSGTTGNPKGVLLSHGNLTSNFIAGGAMFPELDSGSRSLSVLPWAHSYGQTAELYNFINIGGSMGFVRDVTTISEDIAQVAPTFLIAVPRIFNKIYDGLLTKINTTGGIAKRLFMMGLESAAHNRRLAEQGKKSFWNQLKYRLADRVVFSKIRQRFGGRLNGALTASAMMNIKVAQFFTDIGLPVFDAYGLTETSPAVTMNNREANKPGSVGRPIDQVRVTIDASQGDGASNEGEVVVYGPNVMQGYQNRPEATQAVMTEEGGFRTGDIGWIDDDGFLFITGRIKEQYKLENGKYVFPATLEEEIQLSPWVENALVFGDGRRHNICLVVPDMDKLTTWSKARGLENSPKDLLEDPEAQAIIRQSILDRLEGKFKHYEIPRDFIWSLEPFSVENGLLTQTLKLKRKKVVERYREQIDASYAR